MTIHIIGGNGYIARRITSNINRESGLFLNVIKYDLSNHGDCVYFDLTSKQDVDSLKIGKSDFIVFLAAVSSPDICEDQYQFAYSVNVMGTSRLIDKALSAEAKVLFFSSDTVLGETCEAIDENYSANPFGAYARMKYEIEEKYKTDKNFKVFRLSYVFSRTDKFTSYLINCAESCTTAEVYDSLYRNVIYIEDVIDAIIALYKTFEKHDNFLFHLAGGKLLSRVDMAETLKEEILTSLQITVKDTPPGFFDKRPPVINMKSLYLNGLLNRQTTSFKEAVKHEFRGESFL